MRVKTHFLFAWQYSPAHRGGGTVPLFYFRTVTVADNLRDPPDDDDNDDDCDAWHLVRHLLAHGLDINLYARINM